jgi:hypothetical protein
MPPSTTDSVKNPSFILLTNKIKEHKKSCVSVICLILVIIVLVIVWAHNCEPDHFMAKYKAPWSSPDYKLLKKNHAGRARRSDSKEDNWNKDDFLQSVKKFNKLAAAGKNE